MLLFMVHHPHQQIRMSLFLFLLLLFAYIVTDTNVCQKILCHILHMKALPNFPLRSIILYY